MSMDTDLLSDLELAKTYIVNSKESDQYKRSMLRILNASALATNGLSPEEKIQKMSETLFSLVISQVMFSTKIDDRIDQRIKAYNKETYDREHCGKCDVDSRNKNYDCVDDDSSKYNQPNHITVITIIRELIGNPFTWLFLSVAIFSPFLSEIIKQILSFFSK